MRKMSPRERTLLGVLAALLAVTLYYLLFFSPLQAKRAAVRAGIADTEDSIVLAQARVAKKAAMQTELDAIFAADPNPTRIPDYDNVRAVIRELNQILSGAEQYSIDFGDLEGRDGGIVRRPVALSFSCASYEAVRSILEQLGSSDYRCLITDVSIANEYYSDTSDFYGAAPAEETVYTVSAQINFYEYAPDTAGAG